MASLAAVDSFYIALIRPNAQTVFPYTFDRGKYIEPDILPYRAGGLTHWIMASRRTYRWSEDNGALLGRGVPFGAEADVSRDALVTPMIDPVDGEVDGLMSVQSYTSNAFTTEHEIAFEWLAQAAMLTISRDEQDRDRVSMLYPDLDTSAITGLSDLISHVSVRLGTLHGKIDQLNSHPAVTADPSLRSLVAALASTCEDLQIETAEATATEEPAAPREALPALTPRETEIVRLIADDLSNHQIATALNLSEKTVKSHVTNILKKFNATQRSAVAWQVRALTGET